MELSHGGDIAGFVERYGVQPLDFSVNVNPFGLSPGARRGLERAKERACQYPDPLCRRLRRAIGAHEGVPPDRVLCGNGAAELIWRVVLASRPRRALVTAPTFSEYETALAWWGCAVDRHYLDREDGFRLDDRVLGAIGPDTDIFFLCTPNNPTGQVVEKDLLLQILARCGACGTLLVVDECFLGFLHRGDSLSLKDQLAEHRGLLVLKAFTKLYGMAGLRLGYGLCGNGALLDRMAQAGQCWPVSVAAEEAGLEALEDRDFVARTVELLQQERERMRDGIARVGLKVFPGQGNFLLFYTDLPDYGRRLARQGILVRDCSGYHGLGEGFYRTAILTPEKNDRLLAAMDQIGRDAG